MKLSVRAVLGLIIALLALSLACTCDLASLLKTETPTPTMSQPAPSDLLMEDDFGSDDSGWEEGDYSGGSVGYGRGYYYVSAEPDSFMWGVAYRSFDDVVIDVDATQVSAPSNDNNGYGVCCREQGDGDGYYLFISGDGMYSIFRGVEGSTESLVEWASSSAIRQGDATNHIRAICDGSRLTLVVNGEELASTTDSLYSEGDVGLAAASFESDPTEIHFDSFVVREP
jgi:hypothetical protein